MLMSLLRSTPGPREVSDDLLVICDRRRGCQVMNTHLASRGIHRSIDIIRPRISHRRALRGKSRMHGSGYRPPVNLWGALKTVCVLVLVIEPFEQ